MILCDCFRLRQRVDQCSAHPHWSRPGRYHAPSVTPSAAGTAFPQASGNAPQAAGGAVSVHTFRRAGCFTDADSSSVSSSAKAVAGSSVNIMQHNKQDAEQSFFHLLHSSLSSASNVRFALSYLLKGIKRKILSLKMKIY